MSKFDEVTIILLAAKFESELPKMGQFKKLLGTSDVHLYKSGGYFSQDVKKILEAIAYSSTKPFPLDHYGPYGPYCSDLLLVKAGACNGSFLKITYPELVVDGFDLTKKNFEDLELLLKKIDAAKDVHFSYESWCRDVQRNIDKFKELGINDPSVVNFDVAAIDQQRSMYAIQTITNVHNDINQWVTQNRWK